MRITQDKNGDPFGYCEATCSQQMRIGGDRSRVKRFIERFPWAAGAPVTDTAPAPKPVPTEHAKPKQVEAAPAPAPVPEVKPARGAMSSMADALSLLGIK